MLNLFGPTRPHLRTSCQQPLSQARGQQQRGSGFFLVSFRAAGEDSEPSPAGACVRERVRVHVCPFASDAVNLDRGAGSL